MKNKVLIKLYRDLRCTYAEDTYEYTLRLGYHFHDNMFFTFSKYSGLCIQRGIFKGDYFTPTSYPKKSLKRRLKVFKIPCKVESYYV